MDFGDALKLLRAGAAVTRTGWNGADQFVYLVGPGRYNPTSDVGYRIALDHVDHKVPYKPYFALKTVDGEVVPWQPSISDCLAYDWEPET